MKYAVLFLFLFSLRLEAQTIPPQAFSIQVFSSKDKKEAKEMSYRYTEAGKPFLWPAKINGELWYRVYVGLYETKREGMPTLLKIRQEYNVPEAFFREVIKK